MRRRTARRIRCWLLIALAVLVVLGATYCVLRFGFSIDVLDRTGWNEKNGITRYLDYWGRPQTGWRVIDDNTYYFAQKDGAMVTGWTEIDGARYYFREDGTKASGWLETDGDRYWLGSDGALDTGWLQLDGKTYYLAPETGKATLGWLVKDDKKYYFTEDGSAATGWTELEGVRFYFREDGSVATGWVEDASGRYYFDENGYPQSGWLEWEQKKYYLNADGSVTTGWLTLEQDRYYFLPTGRMAIGEVEVDGVSRFFTSKGKEVLLCNPWHPIPADFELDLVDTNGKKIDRDAKEPLEQMMQAAKDAGIRIGINNSYRSHATQQRMWDKRLAQRLAEGMTQEEAVAKIGESLAIPGHSEHETGLALDVNSGSRVYKWLGENCWDYGFILRYPDDKIDITGIIYEPWHFRYVGTELSLELKELGLCMEEYMTMLNEQQQKIPD